MRIVRKLRNGIAMWSAGRRSDFVDYWWMKSRTEVCDKNCRSSYPRFARDELVATSAIACLLVVAIANQKSIRIFCDCSERLSWQNAT